MIAPADTSLVAIRRWTWPALAIGIVAIAAAQGIAQLVARSAIARVSRGLGVFVGNQFGEPGAGDDSSSHGRRWGLVLRRILEAQMRTLPVVALLFVPLALRTIDFIRGRRDTFRATRLK